MVDHGSTMKHLNAIRVGVPGRSSLRFALRSSLQSPTLACRVEAWSLKSRGEWPAFALRLQRGSLRFSLRSKRRLVEAAGVESGCLHFSEMLIFRAFPLISGYLSISQNCSIIEIRAIFPSKMKRIYTKFTPSQTHDSSPVSVPAA